MPIQQTLLRGYGVSYKVTGGRGVILGGEVPGSYTTVIDYITIASTGNASDFGDLTVARGMSATCSNGSRGCSMGGKYPGMTNTIDYITFGSLGNATDFGDTAGSQSGSGGVGSYIGRGVVMGGDPGPARDRISYIQIDTTSNTSNFGDLSSLRAYNQVVGNGTRAVCCGGEQVPGNTTMEYVTVATTGDASSFGNLATGAEIIYNGNCTVNSEDRGLIVAGIGQPASAMQYFTISSTGNASNGTQLESSGQRYSGGTCSNGNSRGIAAGGNGNQNKIWYWSGGTGGTASDFGDLITGKTDTNGNSGD